MRIIRMRFQDTQDVPLGPGTSQLIVLLHLLLEDQLARVLEKNTELTIKNTNLQKQVQQLQNVKSGGSPDCTEKLETVLKQMREATDKKKELEKEHSEAVAQLREKQSDIQRKISTTSDKTKAYESIETLQSKIRELEKKAELQNVLHEELALEMQAIKRSTKVGNCQSWNKPNLDAHMSPDTTISNEELGGYEDSSMQGDCNSLENHVEHRPILKSRTQFAGRSSVGGRQLPLQPKVSSTSYSHHHSSTAASMQPSSMTSGGYGGLQDPLGRQTLSGSLATDPTANYILSNTGMPIIPPTAQTTIPLNLAQTSICNTIGAQYPPYLVSSGPNASTHIRNQAAIMLQPTHPQPRLMPQIPNVVPQYDLDRIYGAFPDQHMSTSQDPKVADMLDIPGKGRCYVYIARYSYDPFQQSPNECPEAELAVNAGDYILVWGNMDEDGFFDAELLDGRRGLVPSNFVQKLVGDDLLDFHHSVIQGLRDCDDSASTNIPHDFDYHHSGEFCNKKLPGDYDLIDILEDDDDEEETEHSNEGPVPAPKQLTLERQLNKSILIGWNPPDTPSSPAIDCYHVYVDRVLKVTVKATERTRALVEGVDSNRPHRISVRSVTANRRTSRDAACTMVIGKDVPLGPTNVKASRVTATSAVISWLPSNSNYQHVVCVNNVELRTVKPGVYRHTITGLPEPPVDIQVEPGPQDGTLLVTWQPSSSCSGVGGSIVTGYAVYADGKKVTDVDSPSGDHALIDINKLLGLNPKQVTVRSKSRESQSSDSIPTQIPSHILQEKHPNEKEAEKRSRYTSSLPPHMRHQHRPGQVIETEENLSDKEIYPSNNMSIPAIEITKDTEGNYSEDDYMDRRGVGRGHYDSRNTTMRARNHHMPQHSRHHRRDERDQFYSDRVDGRARERDKGGYRGPRGMQQNTQPVNNRDKRARWFVALFDYDPTTMSPNPDACDEELPFSEGDTIKVYGEKDADGFYWGECRGRRGYVPHNMVVEVQGLEGGVTSTNKDRSRERDRWGDTYINMPVKKMIAMYDYDPQELSPNVDAEVELSFQTGNIIYVYGDMDDDGFYMGELDGMRGLVPSNFLTEAEPNKRSRPGADRGHGPGARGPPPPPRPEPRSDRRKDACPANSLVDHRQIAIIIYVKTLKERASKFENSQRAGGASPSDVNSEYLLRLTNVEDGRIEKETSHNAPHPTVTRKYQAPPNPVVQLPPPTETKSEATNPPISESLGPNIMQKLTEMTQDNSVDHILTKGKELIFMKFGLGK